MRHTFHGPGAHIAWATRLRRLCTRTRASDGRPNDSASHPPLLDSCPTSSHSRSDANDALGGQAAWCARMLHRVSRRRASRADSATLNAFKISTLIHSFTIDLLADHGRQGGDSCSRRGCVPTPCGCHTFAHPRAACAACRTRPTEAVRGDEKPPCSMESRPVVAPKANSPTATSQRYCFCAHFKLVAGAVAARHKHDGAGRARRRQERSSRVV